MRARLLPVVLLLAAVGSARPQAFTLESSDVPAQARIGASFVYAGLGCAGDNRSPALAWRNPPPGTAGYALTVFDPDAGAHGWWHWLVLDLPPQTTGLPTGAADAGLPAPARQLSNDFGESGYGGPCPPPGQAPHRYQFTVYALKQAQLHLPAGTDHQAIAAALRQQALGSASFTAFYGR